jgi:hypothetical protein
MVLIIVFHRINLLMNFFVGSIPVTGRESNQALYKAHSRPIQDPTIMTH